jgi:hypothetical protein
MPKPMWEIVYTLDGYYDGPLSGIADHTGVPHFYQAQWNELEEQFDHYQISPVNSDTFKLALEAWTQWNRWGLALTTGSTIPAALVSERHRYEQIQSLLQEHLVINPLTAIRVRGKFRSALKRVSEPYLEVLWTIN